MAYKDILVYADADKAAPVRLDVAAALAARHNAHLTALHVVAPPFVPIDIGAVLPAQFIQLQEDFARERADKAEKEVSAAEKRSGRAIEWRQAHGDVQRTVLTHSHYVDLVIVGQGGADDAEPTDADGLPESIIMDASRPVLIVPRYGRFATLGDRVLVAWNRTREATRALHDSLPVLVDAKSVTIMEVNPERGEPQHNAGADIAAHLARHGVRATASSTVAGDIAVGDAILSRAADLGVDLLVMGAYGHSRLREYVFGGVTLHLLRHMTVPVLMSH